MKLKYIIMGAVLLCGAASCVEDDTIILPDFQDVAGEEVDGETPGISGRVAGFYVLNEGMMGLNKATIDYFDYVTARYARNIYPSRNPSVVMELGDTGNDIAVYGDRLYIVVNGSHKVEVCDAVTAERIGQVDIDSPRCIVFEGNYAYVSSAVGGTGDNGSVVRINLSTLKADATVSVGLMPEEMVVVDGRLYVANSQNYGVGRFDNTISVVDLASFTFDSSITVGVNLHHLRLDGQGNMWVNSRGNYYDEAANLYKLTRTGDTYGNPVAFDIDCTNFAISGDKLYYYTSVYDANWNAVYTYGTIDTATGAIGGSFITDGTASEITTPYCIAIQPYNGDIFITDAKNYTSSGRLYCYNKAGELKWSVTTGDLPGHIAFVER
ncbi:MAG: YncE family protein [Muribaculaceae bacterium]|nr:YncE family protein [Muribaculaceae bacterium]